MSAPGGSRTQQYGPYFFYIEGLPKKYTWQDLKDLIRKEASHGVWTDMAFYPNGQTGGKGHARVQRRDEAAKLYVYLTASTIEGRRLIVHLWDISGSEAKFLRCNCSDSQACNAKQQSTYVTRMAAQPGWQIAAPDTPMQLAQSIHQLPYHYPGRPLIQPGSAHVPQASLEQAMSNMQLTPQGPCHLGWQQQQYLTYEPFQPRVGAGPTALVASPSTPGYTLSSSGTPINTANGTIRTEARGVFVSGINYKAEKRDVEALFSKVGRVIKCDMPKDASTGRSRGHATVHYATAVEAQKAITSFHHRTYMGLQLSVREDRERTAIRPSNADTPQTEQDPQPVIVNGS